ncbi:antigen identified by monoclonal antibody Ki-67 [Haplosporangium sp. Z 27]|nr:antigen identified by monoclonal antibody Ki-67 [Haplosporangium sp. Z 27]
MGVWGHVVGLKKQDESVYYRYPIDKSYCSFGRNDTNDIRVQIDAVSDLHCKLIRRDDGEVWLKDTSINGTLLNNVLVHDTARPIQHNDVMTIAGRISTPGRMINNIQKTIDDDIQILAEIPSPTTQRLLLTPKKNTTRSTAALESSLGLFTPNRAAKLSSLLVSPKPVPLPAFLAKSPMRISTPRKVLTMIDEPSILNPTCTAVQPQTSTSDFEPGLQTPSHKRRVPVDFDSNIERTPKKVSFGPALSPEIFDKAEPPSTPVKRGQQQGILTPRRHGVSTPSLLSKLSALKPTTKPILTPSRLSRTSVIHDLQKPTPLDLFAADDTMDELESVRMPILSPFGQGRLKTQHDLQKPLSLGQLLSREGTPELKSTDQETHHIVAQESATNVGAKSIVQDNDEGVTADIEQDTGPSNDGSVGSNSDDGLWNKLVPVPETTEADLIDQSAIDESQYDLHLDDLEDDDDSLPSTPTRGPMGRILTPSHFTPTRPRRLSDDLFQQEHTHHAIKLSSSPQEPQSDESIEKHPTQRESRSPSPSIVTNNPKYLDGMNPFEETPTKSQVRLELSPSSFSTPLRGNTDPMDTTPAHTPVHRKVSSSEFLRDETPFGSTPNSASRLALLQLSAQKIRGLPDLLQSPNSSSSFTPSRPTMTLPPYDQLDDDIQEESNNMESSVENKTSATEKSSEPAKAVSVLDPKRRSSAPAAVNRGQSPIFSGIRGVFRTPQKVVESCFAGIAGIRNFMSPPRPLAQLPSSRQLSATAFTSESNIIKADDNGEKPKETAVENLDVRESVNSSDNKENQFVDDGEATSNNIQKTPTKFGNSESTTTTPKRRIASHQDVMAILLGNPQSPSPKSKEFSFVKESSVFASSSSLDQIKARGRRSDIFPQKRTIAIRSNSQSADDHVGTRNDSDITKVSGEVIGRRRTISLVEFKGKGMESGSATVLVTSQSNINLESEPKDGEETGQKVESENGEDIEQAELLRILGEGAESSNDEDEVEGDYGDEYGKKENIKDDVEDNNESFIQGDEESRQVDGINQKVLSTSPASRRISLSNYGKSFDMTPTKRRHSFKQRLGSASPGFKLYEQEGGMEGDEENEDDMVVMMSPKRVRVRSFLGDC